VLNVVVTLLFLVNLIWRWGATWDPAVVSVPVGPVVLSALGVGILFVAGYLGGLMVFDQGVSVARMSKKRWRQEAEKGGANLPDDGGDEGS
jgi:hypothetical protein